MRVPKNIAKINYTTGEKYLDSNFNPYVGYYCEVKGKIYPGKVYTGKSKQLILASSLVKDNKISGIHFNQEDTWHDDLEIEDPLKLKKEYVFRYFVKYTHTVPIYIKEINIDTYNSVRNNPLYQTLMLKFTISDLGGFPNNGFFNKEEVERADKEMFGIKLYLQEEIF
jgi:hypothetical protein